MQPVSVLLQLVLPLSREVATFLFTAERLGLIVCPLVASQLTRLHKGLFANRAHKMLLAVVRAYVRFEQSGLGRPVLTTVKRAFVDVAFVDTLVCG